MKAPEATLRFARWPELVFAIIALYLASSLPLPPQGSRGLWLIVHWYGTALVAAGLVIALRRPSRVSWVAALALSAYFVANCAIGLLVLARGGMAAAYAGPAVVVSYAILGVALLAQLVVAAYCWRARAIWRGVPPGELMAPVA